MAEKRLVFILRILNSVLRQVSWLTSFRSLPGNWSSGKKC